MSSISVSFCNTLFANPFILPSGIITEIAEHKKAIDAGAGGVTLKSITWARREGNPLPRMWKYEHGMLNSVGLRNPGIEEGVKQVGEFLATNKEVPVIVSLFSTRVDEFVKLVEKIVPLNPPFIELNLSCPNTTVELGKAMGMDKGAAERVVAAVKKVSGKIPVLAKLLPNVIDINEVAKACEAAGADGIVAINTVGPGMVIDINKRKPTLGNKEGGVSGPGILPVAVRCVYDIYKAVKIPIIGMGGVTTITDVLQMFMAGATLVGVGTATYTNGMGIYEKLKKELALYLVENKIDKVKDLVGRAHNI